ncbi:MAG: hypothetical protein LBR28_01150 [Bacteroidales bacterium]|jgi:tetratricopeptide (TPR) repeat protein|nr:hypothetical protein [Bacteroidales bacterium]
MNEYFDNEDLEQEYGDLEQLIKQFKYQIANKEPVFFSSEDFIEIIDYLFTTDNELNFIDTAVDTAYKLYPDNVEIVLRRCQAETYFPSNEYTDTIAAVMSFAEQMEDSNAAYIYKQLATELFDDEEFDKAIHFYKLSLIKNPLDEEVLEGYVLSASRQTSKRNEHILFLETLAKTNPYSSFVWYFLALLSFFYNKFKDTLDYIECAIALDKNNTAAHRCKAEALVATGKIEEGIIILTLLNLKEPDNPQVLFSLGNAYEQKEEWDKAISYYKACLSKDEFNFSAIMNAGICYYYNGDFNTAKYFCQKAIEAEPDNYYFKISYASMLYEEGYKEEAENLYRKIFNECDEKDVCAINWALSLSDDGKLKDAIHILDSTITTCTIEDPTIYYTIIDLAVKDGHYTEMVNHYLYLLFLKFQISKEELLKSCPSLKEHTEYNNLITKYLHEEN